MKRPNLSRSQTQNVVLALILLAMIAYFTAMNPRFLGYRNFINISRQTVQLFLLGSAMTFVIVSGAIDLSVGGVMGFSAVMFAYFCKWGINIWVSALLVVLIGVCIGILNGILVEQFKIPAIMATIATMTAFGGLASTICSAIPVQTENIKPVTILNKYMFFDVIPLPLVISVVVVSLFIFLERKTILGKYAMAIGGNEHAAHFSGINVKKIRMILFVMSAVMAAVAGILATSRTGQGDPTTGKGMEFTIIAACILGGVNIKGGAGTITGMTIGTLVLAILVNGMNFMGINSFYQQVAIGMVLLVSVLIGFATQNSSIRQIGTKLLSKQGSPTLLSEE